MIDFAGEGVLSLVALHKIYGLPVLKEFRIGSWKGSVAIVDL